MDHDKEILHYTASTAQLAWIDDFSDYIRHVNEIIYMCLLFIDQSEEDSRQ